MNEEKFMTRIYNTENALYNKIFLKSSNLNEALKKCMLKHTKWLTFTCIRYTQILNCMIRADKENLYNQNFDNKIQKMGEICIYLDKILENLVDFYEK